MLHSPPSRSLTGNWPFTINYLPPRPGWQLSTVLKTYHSDNRLVFDEISKPGLQLGLLLQRIRLMTKKLSRPNLDIAQFEFLHLISSGWNEVGHDVSMELRALGNRPQSLLFNPEKEEELAATLEAAVQLNASGSNIHVTVNPAKPFTPDCKTRALKDTNIVVWQQQYFLMRMIRGIAR